MATAILERAQLKKELFAFLIITFAATYLLDFAIIYMMSGPLSAGTSKLWQTTAIGHMLLPATAAIICMVYFKSYTLRKETKIIFTFFLIYTILYFFESYFQPILGTIMNFPLVSSIIAVLGILTVVILNLKKKWRDDLEPSKLSVGKNLRYYIVLPLILSIILIANAILNFVSGLGIPAMGFNLSTFFSTLMVSTFIMAFLLWPSFFGEEYGWRVYLQDRLFPLLGGYKGVLILGIIWGVWHTPGILIGSNFPGYPILGNLAMIFSTIILGIIFSYAVLKTGSVWIAVILHLVTDVIEAPAKLYIATSFDSVFSFTGIFGTALLAIFALILLRSKVWKINEKVAVTE